MFVILLSFQWILILLTFNFAASPQNYSSTTLNGKSWDRSKSFKCSIYQLFGDCYDKVFWHYSNENLQSRLYVLCTTWIIIVNGCLFRLADILLLMYWIFFFHASTSLLLMKCWRFFQFHTFVCHVFFFAHPFLCCPNPLYNLEVLPLWWHPIWPYGLSWLRTIYRT